MHGTYPALLTGADELLIRMPIKVYNNIFCATESIFVAVHLVFFLLFVLSFFFFSVVLYSYIFPSGLNILMVCFHIGNPTRSVLHICNLFNIAATYMLFVFSKYIRALTSKIISRAIGPYIKMTKGP